jgi:hypothetical protein
MFMPFSAEALNSVNSSDRSQRSKGETMSKTVGLLWLAVIFLFSLLAGVAGGILARFAGRGLADAVITGAVACGSTAGLLVAVLGLVLAYLSWSRGQ